MLIPCLKILSLSVCGFMLVGCSTTGSLPTGSTNSTPTTVIRDTTGTTVAVIQNGRILSTNGSTIAYIRGSNVYSTSGNRIANFRAK